MDQSIASTVMLNNGIRMPILGLGVYQTPPGQATRDAVSCALECGYRRIDTARFYGNEGDVGLAIRESGIPRQEIFVTTKLWNSDHGYDPALRAFDASLEDLGFDYLDLYLIHWPVEGAGRGGVPVSDNAPAPAPGGLRSETWKALETILVGGRCLAIGVSNYTVRHLEELLASATVVPAVNQVEFSPFLYQEQLLDYCRRSNIQLEAYSPLTRGKRLKHPVLTRIARKYSRSAAQVLIRWAVQHGLAVIPKSAQRHRIAENAAVFDFSLSAEDMQTLDGLNEDLHLCWDPTSTP